jgi:hypothetical protein
VGVVTDPRAALAEVLDLFQSANDDAAIVADRLAERGVLLVDRDLMVAIEEVLNGYAEHYDLWKRVRAALSAEVPE